MGLIKKVKKNFSSIFKHLFKKKIAKIGIYGPPNAGKTTLANRIIRDWTGDAMGAVSNIPHETRRARRREGVTIESNGSKVTLDIVDTPGLATKVDFHEFMAHGLEEEEAKRRAKEATEGIIEAVKWLDDLDGVILVMDATEDPFTQVRSKETAPFDRCQQDRPARILTCKDTQCIPPASTGTNISAGWTEHRNSL